HRGEALVPRYDLPVLSCYHDPVAGLLYDGAVFPLAFPQGRLRLFPMAYVPDDRDAPLLPGYLGEGETHLDAEKPSALVLRLPFEGLRPRFPGFFQPIERLRTGIGGIAFAQYLDRHRKGLGSGIAVQFAHLPVDVEYLSASGVVDEDGVVEGVDYGMEVLFLLPERALDAPLPGHVVRDSDYADDLAGFIPPRSLVGEVDQWTPVSDESRLPLDPFPGPLYVFVALSKVGRSLSRQQFLIRPADHIGYPIAEGPGSRFIDNPIPSFGVFRENRLGRALYD